MLFYIGVSAAWCLTVREHRLNVLQSGDKAVWTEQEGSSRRLEKIA